jgi:hypothetical protein
MCPDVRSGSAAASIWTPRSRTAHRRPIATALESRKKNKIATGDAADVPQT